MKKAAFYTLGCKLNFAETSTIAKTFKENGFIITSFQGNSDIYVVNTCTVSQRADKECRKIIRSIINRAPDAYIIVTGCYAQLRPEEIASIEGVDLVLGNKEKFKIKDYIPLLDKTKSPQIFVSELSDSNDFGIAFSGDLDNRTRAFLKIQDGCDFHCSFCTIPLARGESRSQPIDITVKQATYLAEKGYKEIVLSGVNVGDYGKKNGESLLKLLQHLVLIDGLERIRISSIEPNLLNNQLIEFILNHDKLCNHFHIPLQSGSDEVLRSMRRRYTSEDYKNLVQYIKKLDSTAAIGADVIVGFPAETEKHFETTYSFILDLPFSYLHVFTYSERPNTPAAELKNQIQPRIRYERSKRLRLIGKKKKFHFYSQFLNKKLPVLFESDHQDGFIYGFTENYIRVRTNYSPELVNKIIPVEIVSINDDVCDVILQMELVN